MESVYSKEKKILMNYYPCFEGGNLVDAYIEVQPIDPYESSNTVVFKLSTLERIDSCDIDSMHVSQDAVRIYLKNDDGDFFTVQDELIDHSWKVFSTLRNLIWLYANKVQEDEFYALIANRSENKD